MSTFQVRVHSLGDQTAEIVGSMRLFTELGVRNVAEVTNYIARHSPCLLVAGVDQDVAEYVVEALTRAGASAEMELSPSDIPMLLCPEVSHRHHWDSNKA